MKNKLRNLIDHFGPPYKNGGGGGEKKYF